jgi:hypothetical protein
MAYTHFIREFGSFVTILSRIHAVFHQRIRV